MKPGYKPTITAEALAHVVEECGEVQAAIGKAMRFGLDCYNPELPEDERETNRAWIEREMADVEQAIAGARPFLKKGK